MIIETSPERRSYTIPLYITIGPFTWNIVTLSITENKFINNPFIVCLEWYLSWKIVTLSITKGNLLNNPFILLVVCAWNGTYPGKNNIIPIFCLFEKINVREGVISRHISKITMDKEKEIPWYPTTTMYRGLWLIYIKSVGSDPLCNCQCSCCHSFVWFVW